ncbi:MAG: phosphatase [Eubacteriales bacterium]
MNKKYAARAAAVIEIGSNNVRMQISQMSKGVFSTLDNLEYPVNLGHDVFGDGYISFDSLRELSAVLGKFSEALLSYGIEKPKVISCTVMREAKNRSLAADQLKVRNGMNVSVLEDSEEKAYLYSEIVQKLENAEYLKNCHSLIAFIGSGSIGIAVYDGNKVIYSQNISMGALKLHDVMAKLHRDVDDFHQIIEEYLDTVLNRIHISEFHIQNLILTGSEIHQIARLCGAKGDGAPYRIETKKLTSLYYTIRSMSPESIGQRYGISTEKAAVFYSALSIYCGMLRFCKEASGIISPAVDISEAVARYLLASKTAPDFRAYLRESALACAEVTAKRFGCNLEHSERTSSFSCKLFDKLKKLHGLDPSKRLILELASLLHSCGSYVSVRQHNKCTYDLIKGMDIFGLRQLEVSEIAFVAGSITENFAAESNSEFVLLPEEEKIIISKLAAIFRMANALDKSHQGKLSNLRVNLEEDRVLFRADAVDGNYMLERWAFEESAGFFKNVFGLSPELIVKLDMI